MGQKLRKAAGKFQGENIQMESLYLTVGNQRNDAEKGKWKSVCQFIRCHSTENPGSWEITSKTHDKTDGRYSN